MRVSSRLAGYRWDTMSSAGLLLLVISTLLLSACSVGKKKQSTLAVQACYEAQISRYAAGNRGYFSRCRPIDDEPQYDDMVLQARVNELALTTTQQRLAPKWVKDADQLNKPGRSLKRRRKLAMREKKRQEEQHRKNRKWAAVKRNNPPKTKTVADISRAKGQTNVPLLPVDIGGGDRPGIHDQSDPNIQIIQNNHNRRGGGHAQLKPLTEEEINAHRQRTNEGSQVLGRKRRQGSKLKNLHAKKHKTATELSSRPGKTPNGKSVVSAQQPKKDTIQRTPHSTRLPHPERPPERTPQQPTTQQKNRLTPGQSDVDKDKLIVQRQTLPVTVAKVVMDKMTVHQKTHKLMLAKTAPKPGASEAASRNLAVSNVVKEVNRDYWQRIISGFGLRANLDKREVLKYINYYMKHPQEIERLTTRASVYLPMIVQKIQQRNMPMEIALLPFVESAYQPKAHSPANAVGLWQFIPGTGRQYGLSQTKRYDGRMDPKASTEAALDYLAYLHNLFNGDWLLALAAYNAGEGRVRGAVKEALRQGKKANYWTIRLPKETRAYVPRLLAYRELIKDAHDYSLDLHPSIQFSNLVTVSVPHVIDLRELSKRSGMPEPDTLVNLNPGFKQGVTTPDFTKEILVPRRYQKQVERNIHKMAKTLRDAS